MKLARRACVIPRVKTDYFDQNESVQDRLYKNLRIWTVYVDLEESLGTFEVSKLKVALKNFEIYCNRKFLKYIVTLITLKVWKIFGFSHMVTKKTQFCDHTCFSEHIKS